MTSSGRASVRGRAPTRRRITSARRPRATDMPARRTTGARRAGLIFGDLWEFDPAPESADPRIKARYDLFIGGKFVRPRSGRYFDSINPSNERKLSEIALAGKADVDAAYAAAA